MITPIWNAYAFFTLYANVDGVRAHRPHRQPPSVLDRYILAKTRCAVVEVTTAGWMPTTCPARPRRSTRSSTHSTTGTSAAVATASGRRRPARPDGELDADKQTPTTPSTRCSSPCAEVAAPFLPMITEEIHGRRPTSRRCRRRPASISRPGPSPTTSPPIPNWSPRWTASASVVSAALRLREDAALRVRLPLPSLTVAGGRRRRSPASRDLHRRRGQRQGRRVEQRSRCPRQLRAPTRRQAARATPRWRRPGGLRGRRRSVGGHRRRDGDRRRPRLEPDEFDLGLVARRSGAVAALRGNDAVVVLETESTTRSRPRAWRATSFA